MNCGSQQLSVYGGTRIKLEPRITAAEPFQARVARFEELVARLGQEVYGRAPSRILNAGAYACRRVEHRQGRVSEHAFGNALDVTGFRFPALPTGRSASRNGAAEVVQWDQALPKPLQRAFTLTVLRDYPPQSGVSEEVALRHREFFEKLARALRSTKLFRSAIGPADPRHRTHLHLDMGPWTYLDL